MQKYANLVDLEKCCQTHTFLQKFVLIQPRTSPPKKMQNFANFPNFANLSRRWLHQVKKGRHLRHRGGEAGSRPAREGGSADAGGSASRVEGGACSAHRHQEVPEDFTVPRSRGASVRLPTLSCETKKGDIVPLKYSGKHHGCQLSFTVLI